MEFLTHNYFKFKMARLLIGQGYEAKIQLRPFDKELYDYVQIKIKKENIDVIHEQKLKEGIDIYVSSAKFAFGLVKKLKKQFKGTSKVTRSLVGLNKKAGKQIHRITVLFRLNPPEEDEE